MKRMIGLALVAGMTLAPGLADARARCASKLAVWSGTSLMVSGAVPAATCIHGTTSNIDSRLISGDHMLVSFDHPEIKGKPFVMATMTGLGWVREYLPLALDRGKIGTADDAYDSGFISIPHGFTANGCLTISLKVTERRNRKLVTLYQDVQKYHTAGVTC